MAEIIKTVSSRGTGRRDYSQNIHKIRRGETYPEWTSRPNEKAKTFHKVFTEDSPLSPGQTVHLVDMETNQAMPWTSPKGKYAKFSEWFYSFDGTTKSVMTMDAQTVPFFMDSHILLHEYEKWAFGNTKFFDPNAQNEHTWDFTVTNISNSPIVGTAQIFIILRTPGD